MPFYSAIVSINCTRKVDCLPHQDDPSCWLMLPMPQWDMQLWFALLNPDMRRYDLEGYLLGRLIVAATEVDMPGLPPVYHVETWLGPSAPRDCLEIAEEELGLDYAFEGALRAWNNSGFNEPGKKYCSQMAGDIIQPVMDGLMRLNPAMLLVLAARLGLSLPKFAGGPIKLNDGDLDFLDSLHDNRGVATGTVQEFKAALGAGT